ncbi:hypothetical protein NQ317_007436 [Molorchus minor]|uniref:Carboxypeptidase n=1 Tax=Molorchus minor TaxID=1323400 RepID=A0ABQ9JHY4_9CUCU|nr:hypothetical protein NQ317_007436 [Molorchus minor]
MKLILIIASFIFGTAYCAFPNIYGKPKQFPIVGALDDPLILTPLIRDNKLEEARTASNVNSSVFLGVESYSGYLTVDENYDSNMFFWVVQGLHPLYGLFEEIGPFSINSNMELELRPNAWTESHSVIFIDNPVGTGYSFTSDGGYAQNETKSCRVTTFFVTGESYAGKYIPAIGYTILKKNPEAELKINLQGLSIGNGLSDPENQLKYGAYLYQLGMIDANTKELFNKNEEEVAKLIQDGQYEEAFVLFDELLNGDLTAYPTLFKNATGYDNYFNYLYPTEPSSGGSVYDFVQRTQVRNALHVGRTPFGIGPVEENLVNDIMQSVAPWISELLSNYRVLLYNGQMDIIVAYTLTVNYLQNLEFDGADEYQTATRYKWLVDNEIAGYVKQAGNLTEVLVRNAGHMVPNDQPKWARDLITRFVRNEPLYEK